MLSELMVLCVLAIMVTLFGCGGTYKHEGKMSGGTTNKLVIAEGICDKETYPDPAERRVCKDTFLATLKCKAVPKPQE